MHRHPAVRGRERFVTRENFPRYYYYYYYYYFFFFFYYYYYYYYNYYYYLSPNRGVYGIRVELWPFERARIARS